MYLQKDFGPYQPAQTAQADMGRGFLLSLDFLYIEGTVYIMVMLARGPD